MPVHRTIPAKILHASGALLRGAFLLLLFRPSLTGQCRAEAPACLSFVAARKKRPAR